MNRTEAPSIKQVDNINLQKPEIITLDNGIKLYAFSGVDQDVLKLELLFNAGRLQEPQRLVAATTNKMLCEGTQKHSAHELANNIDFFGSYYQTDINNLHASVELYALNKYLGDTLPYLHEILTEPAFPEKELKIYSQNRKQRLIVDNERMDFVARKTFQEMLWGSDHPFGYYATTADYDALDIELLKKFYEKQYLQAGFSIIASGNITKEVIKTINEHLGKISNSKENGEIAVQNPISKPGKHYIEKKDALQSSICIGKPMISRHHPDFAKLLVVNTLFGGYFGSRLMSNIREDKGYTYGIHSGIQSMRDTGYFIISSEVGAAVCNKAIDEIYYELKRLRTETTSQEELDLVKNYMLGTFLRSIDGAFEQADRFKTLLLNDLKYEYYHNYLHSVKTITTEEVKILANQYLHEDSMLEVVVGKM